MFRPSAPLSGGLLWKIPWRLSAPQKLRQRRRLRRVDNIVAVLDNALKQQTASTTAGSTPQKPATETSSAHASSNTSAQSSNVSALRHGRGPTQGSYLPTQTSTTPSVTIPTSTLLSTAAASSGTIKPLERWKTSMPTEQEMLPRDKYSMFDKKVRGYRKGVHKLPKWTRVSQRVNPPGF